MMPMLRILSLEYIHRVAAWAVDIYWSTNYYYAALFVRVCQHPAAAHNSLGDLLCMSLTRFVQALDAHRGSSTYQGLWYIAGDSRRHPSWKHDVDRLQYTRVPGIVGNRKARVKPVQISVLLLALKTQKSALLCFHVGRVWSAYQSW
jgi:hypothetical protein